MSKPTTRDELREKVWLVVRRDASGTDKQVDAQVIDIMSLFDSTLKAREAESKLRSAEAVVDRMYRNGLISGAEAGRQLAFWSVELSPTDTNKEKLT